MLDAEVRIGELTSRIPKAGGGQPFHKKPTTDTAVQSKQPKKPEPAAPIVTEPQRVTQPIPAPEPPKAFFMASKISDN